MSGYYLKNERLKVKIEMPGAQYQRARFSWNTMVSEVVLDGEHQFCTKESLIEGIGSGGQGLWNEFGIEEPIGYEEIGVGEQFPKIGVGLLTKKENSGYDFSKDYVIEPFHFVISKSLKETELKIVSEPKMCNGYGIRLTESISLIANKLRIETCLENVGLKPIDTTEYRHNFFCINHNPIGKEYAVRFSFPVHVTNQVGEFLVEGNEVTWEKPVEEVLYARFDALPKEGKQSFEVLHIPSGVGVIEQDSFPLERLALWGMPHVISPETFVRIKVGPAEEKTWVREYTFHNENN